MRQADRDVSPQPHDDPDHHTANTPRGHGRRAKPQAGRAQDSVGELLGEWQRTELRIARGFAECRGLTTEQLEDIYQDTALALLARPYATEEHLRNALRHGIKHRALNMHRDRRRRSQILAQSAPSMQRVAESRASQAGPEEAALAEQDRLIVREFLAELDELEQRIFWLQADGMRYRAIASALEIPVNEARIASRSCERKRERFQLLYDTGRLCGYRAATIHALQAGEVTSEVLARRAFAHLEACIGCRAEHKTNAKRLGRTFRGELAALLPLPALLGRVAWSSRSWLRASTHLGSGARKRSAALLAAGGTGAKMTAGVAIVAVIAGGAIGATHALEHHTTHARRHTAAAGTGPISEARLTRPPVSHGETTPQRATPHRTRPRRRVAVYLAAKLNLRASGHAADAPEAGQREFGPEATSTGPASTPETARPGVVGNGEAAEREFGTPAAGG
jgi:RNA polymerase sigma factor (sigma-70 family)